jgi:actin-like ATPase involved in cell morphogenesis
MGPYGLGIDVGTGTVTAAVCIAGDGPTPAEALPLPEALSGGTVPGNLPLRLVLARVGDPTPLYGGPEPRTGAAALAALVAGVRRAAQAARGEPPAWTVVAVPPSWGEHRRAELSVALTAELGEECTLVSSAVAAVRHHRSGAAGAVAVYDLGAGSVDTAVVRVSSEGALEHAAVPPAPRPWGGRDIDDAVVQHVCSAVGLTDTIRTPRERARLTALRSACVEAKERLSTELAVRVDVDLPGSRESVRLVRADLDELIAGSVMESVGAVRGAVTEAGLTPAEVDGIVLAGGSALVPLVASTLSAELAVPLLVDDRPGETIACGAAELAADLLSADQATGHVEEEDDEEFDAVVVDLDGYRLMTAAQRATFRIGTVAALLAVLFVTPLSLMGVLDSGVTTRGAQGVAVAEEPPAPEPAAAPAATREASPDAPAGARRSADQTIGPTMPAPRATSQSTAAGPTTAPATTSATAGPAAAAPAPVTTPPPSDPPPSDPPPSDPPPSDPPPSDPPPSDPPPSDPPPSDPPPSDPPPSDPPPTDPPPTDPGTGTTSDGPSATPAATEGSAG